MRNINISNEKKRDSFVKLNFTTPKHNWQYLFPDKQKNYTYKIIKFTNKEALPALKEKYSDENALAEALINEDLEINFEMTGHFLEHASKFLMTKIKFIKFIKT